MIEDAVVQKKAPDLDFFKSRRLKLFGPVDTRPLFEVLYGENIENL